jgi:hypothetical protein
VTARTRVRARRGEGERLREEILAAASRLLVERGSEDAVSVRAIADAIGEAYVRFGLDNPGEYRILFMGLLPAEVSPERVEKWACLQHMVDAVQRAMDAGLIVDGDAFAVTVQLWAAVHGMTSLLIAKPDFPWPPLDALVDGVLAMCAFGLVPR